MKLLLQNWPVHSLAANHQSFKLSPFGSGLQEFSYVAKMAAYFVLNVTFRMASVVACITVATSMPRKRTGEGVQLAELLKLDLQETSRLPVNQCHPKTWVFRKDCRERPEMKPAIHEQLGRRGDWRQVELLPKIPRTASKNGLRTRLIAVQFLSHAEYLFEVVNSLAVASMQP